MLGKNAGEPVSPTKATCFFDWSLQMKDMHKANITKQHTIASACPEVEGPGCISGCPQPNPAIKLISADM